MKEGIEVGSGGAVRIHTLERHGPLGALLFVALGFGLRVRGLSRYWLNPDEGIYYSTLTQASFRDFWSEVMANAHPPAFYLLLRAAGYFTWDFVWLRGLSLVFGTAAIWIFWLLGRELGGRGKGGAAAGLVAAGLLAVSSDSIALSQVLRPYMLLVALLGAALFCLLRYRRDAADRDLIAYVVLASLAVLCHYSADLALAVFVVVVARDGLTHGLGSLAWRRLALVQLIPCVLAAGLFLAHANATLESDLMTRAFESGGWLSSWLVKSPTDAWRNFVAYQNIQVPTDLQGRSAVLLMAAAIVSALSRDRMVALLTGTAVAVAVAASALGVYPFGPTRHNAWLLVFTLPSLGWFVGHLIDRSPRAVFITSAILAVSVLFGGPIEDMLGARAQTGNATAERTMRTRDLASLVVEHLGPDGDPRLILMSDQTYNVMMPLYARERRVVTMSPDSLLFSFEYGARNVIVSKLWDWSAVEDVAEVVRTIPFRLPGLASDEEVSIVLVAGGFETGLFAHVSEFKDLDPNLRVSWAFGPNPAGPPFLRMMAMVFDPRALTVPR